MRRKVAHSTTVVPASDEQLRRDKGLVITEILSVLSLSTQAYEQLKAGEGRDTVKTLSGHVTLATLMLVGVTMSVDERIDRCRFRFSGPVASLAQPPRADPP